MVQIYNQKRVLWICFLKAETVGGKNQEVNYERYFNETVT